jgi:hypothetical protein
MDKEYLKKYTRDQFNLSAVGAEMAACKLLDAVRKDVYDDWKPYFIHETMAQLPATEGSYYLLHGHRDGRGNIHMRLTLGNGNFDPSFQEIMPLGTDFDRIDVNYIITPDEPDFIKLVSINKFRCPNAQPQTRFEADWALREVTGYLKLMKHGHLVNFQKDKIAVWNDARESGRNADKIDALWDKAGITISGVWREPCSAPIPATNSPCAASSQSPARAGPIMPMCPRHDENAPQIHQPGIQPHRHRAQAADQRHPRYAFQRRQPL